MLDIIDAAIDLQDAASGKKRDKPRKTVGVVLDKAKGSKAGFLWAIATIAAPALLACWGQPCDSLTLDDTSSQMSIAPADQYSEVPSLDEPYPGQLHMGGRQW